MYEMKHMRLSSAANMKGTKVGAPTHDYPREGSQNRQAWDRLQANKGCFVSMKDLGASTRLAHIRMQLTNFWGLDIAYKPKGIWCLVGEWKGREYVDYLAEKYK